MRSSSRCLIVATTIASSTMAPLGAQSLRDHVRMHGDTTIVLTACGGLAGLKEIIEIAPFTVEGTITAAESKLTAEEDEVYTEYEIDVIRVFRGPAAAARSTPGPTDRSSPFVAGAPLTRPGLTHQHVRLRRRFHGRVVLDGGVVTAASEPAGPTLSVGQHIIVSAYFDDSKGWWSPFGFFEVRDGRVLNLDNRVRTKNYDSVEDFGAALANPPATTVSLTRERRIKRRLRRIWLPTFVVTCRARSILDSGAERTLGRK